MLFYWKSPCISGPHGSHPCYSRVNCIITASALVPGSSELRRERLCLPLTALVVRLSLGSPCGPAHIWNVKGVWTWPWDMLLWHMDRRELKAVGSQRVQKTAFQEPPSSDSRQSFWTWDTIDSCSGLGGELTEKKTKLALRCILTNKTYCSGSYCLCFPLCLPAHNVLPLEAHPTSHHLWPFVKRV